jgi:hypothetical protein
VVAVVFIIENFLCFRHTRFERVKSRNGFFFIYSFFDNPVYIVYNRRKSNHVAYVVSLNGGEAIHRETFYGKNQCSWYG